MEFGHFELFLGEAFPGIDIHFVKTCLNFKGYHKILPKSIISQQHIDDIQKKICEMSEFYPRFERAHCCNRCTNPACHPSFNAASLNNLLEEMMRAFPEIDQEHIFNIISQEISKGTGDLYNRVSFVLMQEQKFKRRKFNSPPNRKYLFRCPCYKDSTKITLLNRHPDLWKSQIDTVLKETKYYYPSSSLSVSSLSPTGPWAFQQVAKYLFSRKKIDLPKGICCDFESDVEEEERRRREEEEERGEEAAREVEREIQEEDGQLVECECCFDDVPLSFAVVCSSGDHFLCYECIRRYVKENVGPLMVIGGEGEKKEEGGDDCVRFLPCMSMGGCEAVIRSKMIDTALPKDNKKWYDQTLYANAVKRAKGKAISCPSCDTLQISLPPPSDSSPPPLPPFDYFGFFVDHRQHAWLLLIMAWLVMCLRKPFFGFVIMWLLVWVTGYVRRLPRERAVGWLLVLVVLFGPDGRVKRERERREEAKGGGKDYFCEWCKISFCLDCESYHPMERCQQLGKPGRGTAEGLRLYIEEQMSQVTLRVCPECGTHFQKDGGCNKMTCSCGYTMCYICRKGLENEGYSHFCSHFRQNGGSCTECKKCELFHAPNDKDLCVQVAKRAKRDYLAMYPNIAHEGQNLRTVAGIRLD